MGFQFDKWLNYTRARIKDAVRDGNKRLDDLEAKREAERADKPWVSKDGEELSFDQVKARIEWEEEQARKKAAMAKAAKDESASDRKSDDGPRPTSDRPEVPSPEGTTAIDDPQGANEPADENQPAATDDSTVSTPDAPPTSNSSASGPPPRSPQEIAEDAEREIARLELEERERKSKARLEEIRKELGAEPSDPDSAGT